jgi:hypothetical protein
MGRKTMRKYKGGLTPRKSTLKKVGPIKLASIKLASIKLASITKRKNSDEYYGFKLKPLYNKSAESYGFSTSPRSAESYGFSSSPKKNTVRICDRNDPNYYDCISKKKQAPSRKKSPTPSEIKRSKDRRSQEGHHQEFLRRRAEAKRDPDFAAKELAIDDQRLAQLYGQKWNKEVAKQIEAKQITAKNKKNNKNKLNTHKV